MKKFILLNVVAALNPIYKYAKDTSPIINADSQEREKLHVVH